MLSPLDIENKVFKKVVRGYSVEEVDEFLDQIIVDMQSLIVECQMLKKSNEGLNTEIQKCRESESSVLNTIESAKKLMNDISESAEKRAEAIVKNAYLDAEIIKRDAKEEVSKLQEDSKKMKYDFGKFKCRYKKFLEDELHAIDNVTDDILVEIEKGYLDKNVEEETKEEVKEEINEKPVTNEEESNDLWKKNTVVAGDKTLEEMLMEDFKRSEEKEDSEKADAKTIII